VDIRQTRDPRKGLPVRRHRAHRPPGHL